MRKREKIMDNLKFVQSLVNGTRRRRIKWAEPEKLLCWINYKLQKDCEELYFVNLDGYVLSVQLCGAAQQPSLTILDWNMDEVYTIDQENLMERDDGFFFLPEEVRPGDEAALQELFQMAQANSQTVNQYSHHPLI